MTITNTLTKYTDILYKYLHYYTNTSNSNSQFNSDNIENIKKLYPVADLINTILNFPSSFASYNINYINPLISNFNNIDNTSNITLTTINNNLNDILYKELEFFTSNSDNNSSGNIDSSIPQYQKSFYDNINHTFTQIGNINLRNLCKNPITNISSLQIRQNTIANIIPQQEYLKTKLKEISLLETECLNILLPPNAELAELHKNIMFQSSWFQWINYNENILSLYYYFVIIFTPVYGLISPLIFILMQYIIFKYVLGINITLANFVSIFKLIFFGNSLLSNILNKFANIDITNKNTSLTRTQYTVLLIIKYVILVFNSSIGKGLYYILLLVGYLYGIMNCLSISTSYYRVIEQFHHKLQQTAKLVRCVHYMHRSLGHIKELQTINYGMASFFEKPFINELLENDLYINPFHLFVNYGVIMKTYKSLIDIQTIIPNYFYEMWNYIAYIDTLLSISICVTDQSFTPATYINNNDNDNNDNTTKPYINGSEMINICCENSVKNDIILGYDPFIHNNTSNINNNVTSNININNDEIDDLDNDITNNINSNVTSNININNDEIDDLNNDITSNTNSDVTSNTNSNNDVIGDINSDITSKRIMVITGANGSGKSTYIKMLMCNIILAQTIGYVPAKSFILTPFTHLHSYLNIPDVNGKESLFQAEMKRCSQLIDKLKYAENAGEFSFNVIDEIFVSTNQYEGMSSAASILKHLTKYENSLTILITHYDLLTEIKHPAIENYYFSTHDDMNDINNINDYKIKKGINTQHLAISLLKRHGFDNETIKDAQEIYHNIITNIPNLKSKSKSESIKCIDSIDKNDIISD